jgi:hypothetical protein
MTDWLTVALSLEALRSLERESRFKNPIGFAIWFDVGRIGATGPLDRFFQFTNRLARAADGESVR